MSVRPQVDEALAGIGDDWRTALARTLGDAIDKSPNAAMAAELRRLMGVIDANSAGEEDSVVDDLAARRATRRAKATGSQ